MQSESLIRLAVDFGKHATLGHRDTIATILFATSLRALWEANRVAESDVVWNFRQFIKRDFFFSQGLCEVRMQLSNGDIK